MLISKKELSDRPDVPYSSFSASYPATLSNASTKAAPAGGGSGTQDASSSRVPASAREKGLSISIPGNSAPTSDPTSSGENFSQRAATMRAAHIGRAHWLPYMCLPNSLPEVSTIPLSTCCDCVFHTYLYKRGQLLRSRHPHSHLAADRLAHPSQHVHV